MLSLDDLYAAVISGKTERVNDLLNRNSAQLGNVCWDPTSENYVDYAPIHLASEFGYADIVRVLIQHGAMKDAPNYISETPLHIACRLGHVAVVQTLLQEGANAELLDDQGKTPLQHAIECGHETIAYLLLDNDR